jgi:hypothetical protein
MRKAHDATINMPSNVEKILCVFEKPDRNKHYLPVITF